MPTVGSLFSGIGGLDLGLERAGWEVRWQVENDAFCQRVLAKHWPDVPRWGDVRDFPEGAAELSLNETGDASWLEVDLICGGFPCQPVSVAGKRLAQADARWLWPEFARVIRALRPRLVLVENVPGLLVRGVGDVLGDLVACGYDAEWDCIPASAVGAPHRRDRVWIVAYPSSVQRPAIFWHESHGALPLLADTGSVGRGRLAHAPAGHDADGHDTGWAEEASLFGAGREGLADATRDGRESRRAGDIAQEPGRREPHRSGVGTQDVGDTDEHGQQERDTHRARQLQQEGREPDERGWPSDAGWWATEPDVGRVAHGVPARVDRLRGLGNAVVPQVAEWIGRRLIQCL